MTVSKTCQGNGFAVEIIGFEGMGHAIRKYGSRSKTIYNKRTASITTKPHNIDELDASYHEQLGIANQYGDIGAT